jgi:hypothetical protein
MGSVTDMAPRMKGLMASISWAIRRIGHTALIIYGPTPTYEDFSDDPLPRRETNKRPASLSPERYDRGGDRHVPAMSNRMEVITDDEESPFPRYHALKRPRIAGFFASQRTKRNTPSAFHDPAGFLDKPYVRKEPRFPRDRR